MGSARHFFSSRRDDERGATFVLTGICMVLLLWGGAMGVDLGFTVDGNRQTQAMADTGSLDMARYINIADGQISLANSNSYLAGKLTGVSTDNSGSNVTFTETPGIWSGTAFSTPPIGGGCYHQIHPLNAACNAVLVTATQTVPQIFFGRSSTVSRSAIGYLNPEDGFSIGTYLANMNPQQSAVLNALLTPLSSSSVNLTAVGYEGLANTYVTIGQLIAASSNALTPTNVMTASLSGQTWLSIFKAAALTQELSLNCGSTPEPSPCIAYSNLSSLNFSSTTTAKLCQLVSVNGSTCASGNTSEAGLSASLDVLQTLTTEAEVANGTSALDLGTSLGLTGVTDAKLVVQLMQPPQIAFGPVGTTASTAQASMDLQLSVLGTAQVLDVPIAATSGTATLTAVTCSQLNNSFSQAVISGTTTAAQGTITLGGVSVATATVSGAGPTSLGFNSNNVPPTASSFGAASNANPAQIGTATPTITIGVTGVGLSPIVSNLLNLYLPGSLGLVGQAAGITLAGADVADLSINCDAVSLVK